MRAYVCVYLMNNVYLCLSGRGLVCGSVREGCTLRLSDTQTHTDSTQRDTHGSLSAGENLVLLVERLMWFECFVGGRGCSGHSHGWFCQVQIKAALLGGHACYNTQHAFWFISGSDVHACGNIVYLTVRVFLGAVIDFRSFTESTAEELTESSLTDSQEIVSVGFMKLRF